MAPAHVEILAGGIARELFRNGLANDRNMMSASALVHPKHHELVVKAHKDYIEAGATCILTSNACVVPGFGFTPDEIREHTRLAGRLAVEARDRASSHHTAKIYGSLPSLVPSFRSDRTIEHQQGLETYLLIGEALCPFVDAFVATPMSSVVEAKLAFEAVVSLKKPMMVAFALNSTGGLRSGESVVDAIQKLLAFCDESNNDSNERSSSKLRGILFSCSQPENIADALHCVRASQSLVDELADKGIQLGAFADRVSPHSKAGVLEEALVSRAMHSVIDMEVFASFALHWIQDGASIVGGCCGVPLDHIGRICERLEEQKQSQQKSSRELK